MGRQTFMHSTWALVAQGLAYIDFSQPAPENWTLEITDAGTKALREDEYVPDNVPAYLKRVAEDIPSLGAIPQLYLEEALRSFTAQQYIAATMMLGVAAEAVFYDCAGAFADWTPDSSGAALKEILNKEGRPFTFKFEEFRKRLNAHKSSFPAELVQTLDITLNSVVDLFLVVRNQVGHPSGVTVPRENVFQYLVVFPMLAKRFYAIRAFCTVNTAASAAPTGQAGTPA